MNYKASFYRHPNHFFAYKKRFLEIGDNDLIFTDAKNLQVESLPYSKIEEILMKSLVPLNNKDISLFISVYHYLWWNPFWNATIVYLTFQNKDGTKQTVYFKLQSENKTYEFVTFVKAKICENAKI